MQHFIPVWKKAPFLRFLIPLITGIILQWHFQFSYTYTFLIFIISVVCLGLFSFLPVVKKYGLSFLSGIFLFAAFFATGSLLTYNKDIRNDKRWLGNAWQQNDIVTAVLQEPLSEKNKSYKAEAEIIHVFRNDTIQTTTGRIIIYLKKDSAMPAVSYGSQIIFKKPLQEIKNSGNPGGFDYKRYTLFRDISHQVFLSTNDFEILPAKKGNAYKRFLFSTRKKVIDIIRKYIPGEKEQGLAEALLIGYKDDIDKALIQSYSNTGVVHIIAISGLHLGIIYLLLSFVFKPLRKIRWLQAGLIIICLWLFALVAGGSPSVLRSATMFTCIVLAETFARKSSVYNTLALSAFILLCYNPFWLWDVGFQLSYTAVLSIVTFFRSIYNWLYFKNKLLDFLWKLSAVTISAQLLTLPISIYHFHQFPVYFLLTNFLAVPLATLILISLVSLVVFSFIPFIANLIGIVLHWLIYFMNNWVEKIEQFSFAVWDGLQLSIIQTVLLLAAISSFGYWLLEKKRNGVIGGIVFLLGFVSLRSFSFMQANSQKNIIVYNIPQHAGIDFTNGRYFQFIGDSILNEDDFLRNFHIKPSRIANRLSYTENLISFTDSNYFEFENKKIMILDKSLKFQYTDAKPAIDLLILSKNPKVYFTSLAKSFDIKQVVFDASNPTWKINYWKKDCDSLKISWYDVSEKGAFVMKVD